MARTVPAVEEDDATRRSGRSRKSVQRLQDEHKPSRRKSQAAQDGDESEMSTVPSDSEPETSSASEGDESEPEFGQAKAKAKKPRASAGTGANGSAKKKTPAKPRKSAAAGGARKARAPAAGGEGPEGPGVKGDLAVNDDNSIFNAVRNPNSSLQTAVDDWIESYGESTGPAMAELIVFFLRACGCNASVDEHQAEDQDAVPETLEEIQTAFKQDAGLYPLISKSKALRKFRPSLAEFIRRLFASAAQQEMLYEDDSAFFPVFEAWLTSMSSSKIRAFRHTSTVIILMSVSALNEIAIEAKKEDAKLNRAKEAEQKKGRKDKQRLKEQQKYCDQSRQKLDALDGFLDTIFTEVFINRYRDADPHIRSECIASLGHWMKHYPAYWLDGDYLRYIGWVLSDEATIARKESVKALFALYEKDDHIGALQHFTERFKGQLVHMATGELDISVRVQAIQVLRQIEHHGLLEDEQRDTVAQLVFEKEFRVRKVASDFFNGIVQEELERRLADIEAHARPTKKAKGGKKASNEDETRDQLELKCLAELLVKYGRALDGTLDQTPIDQSQDQAEEELELVEVRTHRGRVALAVEGLWTDVEAVRNWQRLVDFLLLDHSAEEESDELNSACKLTEEEETILVELLVGSLKHVAEAAHAPNQKSVDKDQTEQALADVSRAMMDALPRLFVRHQSIAVRMVDLLSVPRLCSLELYVDMRRVNAYEALWDDVTKQFLAHTNPDVLDQAVQTIVHFTQTKQLAQTNELKMAELGEAVVAALRELLAGKDVEADSFDEDELPAAIADLTRLDKIYKQADLTVALLETDGGKQTSAYEIVELLSTRAKLGYGDEADLVEHALEILSQHTFWATIAIRQQQLADPTGNDVDFAAIDDLASKRASFLERLEQLVTEDGCSPAESVKQIVVGILFDQHCFAKTATDAKVDPNSRMSELALTFSDELQARCVGSVEAEIDRHAEEIAEIDRAAPEDDLEADEDAPSDEENPNLSASQRKKKGKGKKSKKTDKAERSPAEIRAENARQESRRVATRKFERTLTPFVRAISVGVLDLEHTAVLIPHLGRFGPAFDAWIKHLLEILRVEGCYAKNGHQVASIVITCIKSAVEAYIDQDEDDENDKLPTTRTDDSLVQLGRALVGAIAVRAQLRIVKQIVVAERVRIQTESLDFLTKKVGALDKAKRTEQRNKALAGFKPLVHLLFNIGGKDALKIKQDLDNLLRAQGVEDVPGTAKAWEPVRAYQKRLTTLMAKDAELKQAAVKQVAKNKAAASSDVEQEDEDALGELEEVEVGSPTAKKTTPVKTSKAKKRQSIALAPTQEEETEQLPARKKKRGLVADLEEEEEPQIEMEQEPEEEIEDVVEEDVQMEEEQEEEIEPVDTTQEGAEEEQEELPKRTQRR